MTTLTSDMLRKPLELKREAIELPEFGEGCVAYVHQLSAGKKNAIEQSMMNKNWTGVDTRKAGQRKERWIVAGLRDAAGNPLLTESDIPVIEQWPAPLRDRIFDAIEALSETKKTVESAEKNSDGIVDG